MSKETRFFNNKIGWKKEAYFLNVERKKTQKHRILYPA